MKKLIFLVSWLLILIQCITPIAAISANNVDTYHSSLITHWDFDENGPYSDKATNGKQDTLISHGTDIEVRDGVAYIPDTAGTYLSASISSGGDLYNFKDKTVVVKASVNNADDGRGVVAAFFSTSKWAWQLTNEANGNKVASRGFNDSSTGQPYVGESIAMDKFRVFVVTFESTGINSVNITYYMSTKEVPKSASDFTTMLTVEGASASNLSAANTFILGRRADHLEADKNLFCYFDDVKIYSDILSMDDVAADCPEAISYSKSIADYSSHLVTHWNFDGAEPLADKAVNGYSADTLTKAGDVTIANGAAYVNRTDGSYLSAVGVAQTDLYSFQNKTVILKLKPTRPDAKFGNMASLISKGEAIQVSMYTNGKSVNGDTESDYDVLVRARENASTYITDKKGDSTANFTGFDDMYHYLIITYSYDSATLKESYYYSKTDSPASVNDFICIYEASTDTTSSTVVTSAKDVIFGKTTIDDTKRGVAFYYDDIKVYDTAFTVDQAVASISAPQYRAAQIATDGDNFDIRFSATLDTRHLEKAGFDIIATYNKTEKKQLSKVCTMVYNSLNANINGTLSKYSAKNDYNSQYIYALTVTGIAKSLISNGEKIEFIVKPYVVTHSNEKIYNETISVTVKYDPNGATEAEKYKVNSIRIYGETEDVPSNIGTLSLIPYNNSNLDVPIHVGLHAFSGVYDIDGDGDMDFISSGHSRSYGGVTGGGLFVFENSSDQKGVTSFEGAKLLQTNGQKPWYSYKTDGSSVFVDENGVMYTTITNEGFGYGKTFDGLTSRFKLYDMDGDGLSDAVYPKGTTEGSNTYDSDGNSLETRTSTIRWKKNIGTEANPVFSETYNSVKNEIGSIFKVSDPMQYTAIQSFSMFDWDGDGDLDLIGGGWQNTFFYYQNIGSKTEPIFSEDGVLIETTSGPLHLDVCRYNMINYDWDGDGKDDLLIGSESGTTLYLRFTGSFNNTTGAPIFEEGKYFTTKAEYLAINALCRPTACDFDGDGDTDFIVGDNSGFLWFYENLTGGTNPSWAAPVKLKDENNTVLVIKAGPNESLQGTREAEWGYIVPTAADWDGDGDFDVIVNSITGRVVWFENIGTATKPQLTQHKAIEVEWENGNLYPSVQWWTPEGNELVTEHRTTPFAMDFNGDGLCDLVMLDHEGYLAFFERYKEGNLLKLKQGERIFVDTTGNPLELSNNPGTGGTNDVGGIGRKKIAVTDWNGDGMLDIIVDGNSFVLYQTTRISNGKYYLQNKGEMSTGKISGHNQGFTIVDWDNDGDPDIVSGTESGYFYYLENTTK